MSGFDPNNSIKFFQILYEVDDLVTIRPIETYEEDGRKKSNVLWDLAGTKSVTEWDSGELASTVAAAAERCANVFIGVCPRQGGSGEYELAWQIGTVRALWVDIDNIAEQEARKRLDDAGLPAPTMLISSGNGVHVYWKLTTAIATGAPTTAVQTELRVINRESRTLKYMMVDGTRVWLHDQDTGRVIKANKPELTSAALQVQDILQGIAATIGGDHTHDLSRLLRLPGSMNRKNERNGDAPKPCCIVSVDPERLYDFELFQQFGEKSPARQKRKMLATIQLPVPRRISASKADKLQEKILRCQTAPKGQRSEADFHLCAWAIEKAVSREEVWLRVQRVGKFAEGGLDYFNRTWEKAAEHTRQGLLARSSGSELSADLELSEESQITTPLF